ncbi:MAG TPA: RluA family pseudouridine synthase [Ktedonobacterales bacterium]|nr:RluA family pseudouridine synthase [Ktedonobacterales bacterium]
MASDKPGNQTTEELTYTGPGGDRLDAFIARSLIHLSRTRVQTLIKQGSVLLNGHQAKASDKLETGDVMLVQEPAEEAEAGTVSEAALPLEILFEDEQILVVNKPAGMVVHPAAGHQRDTLADILLARDPTIAEAVNPGNQHRPGIVHRLDKDTSGLLIVARTSEAMMRLAQQFQEHAVTKRYLALVEGHMPLAEGGIEAPIGRDPRHRQRMTITAQHGRHAQTLFWVEQEFNSFSLVRVQIITGRTHQIRVHLAAIGHPVAGDHVYGRPQPLEPPRPFLHAAELQFSHPTTGQLLNFQAPLPPDLQQFLDSLRT